MVPGATKSPGSGLNPGFLWDNTGYMLGFKADDSNPQRTRETFSAFRQRHLDAEDAVNSSPFSAVCGFLERWKSGDGSENTVLKEAAATGFGVFRIIGKEGYVHEDPTVREWWESQTTDTEPAEEGECLVTGALAPVARTHDKIRGVAGAQSAGGAIIGFNASAYESYGKSQSYNAPVAEAVAFRYVTALNALLDGPQRGKHRMVVGGTTMAFWTDRPSPIEDIFLKFAAGGSTRPGSEDGQDEGQRQRVEYLLRALRDGRPAYGNVTPDPDGTRFWLLALSPNQARIVVRSFWKGSVADLLDSLRKHHADIGITPSPPSGKWRGDPEFPGVKDLLAQSAREAKDIPPLLEAPLLASVVTGAPYPSGLVAAVLRRIRADREVTYLRCCVIKGYLNRNLNLEVSMSLDPARPDPAYRLGRLFAALEKTQKDALGEGLNNTIRDSFYSSASATPGMVFPRLLRTYQHHLAKLDGGHRVNRERLVQEIVGPLESLPPQLPLADQGLFALGYYHQTRDFYTKRADATDS
jgi:CRISPR-associated protein Csd1